MKKLLLLGLALTIASCASRPPPSNFLMCDGMAKPQSAASQFVKLMSASSLLIPTELPETSSAGQRKFGAAGVSSCNSALTEGLVDETSLRYLNLIRARAIHHLENRNPGMALADLALIDKRIGEDIGDASYSRSFGLAVDLVRGIALIQSGDRPSGMTVLRSAAVRRPYALSLQAFLVDFINNADGKDIEVARAVLEDLVLLSPPHRILRASIYDAKGLDPKLVAEDWEYLANASIGRGSLPVGSPKKAPKPIKRGLGAGIEFRDLSILSRAALAQGHAGNVERARYWLNEAQQHATVISNLESEVANAREQNVEPKQGDGIEYRRARSKYLKTNKEIGRATGLIRRHKTGRGNLKAIAPFAEAWIALNEDGVKTATQVLSTLSKAPRTNAVYDLIERIQEAVPKDQRSNVIAMDIAKMKQLWLASTLSGLETGKVSQYAGQPDFLTARMGMSAGGYSRLYGLVPLSEMTTRRNDFSGQAIFFKPTGFKNKTSKQGTRIIEFMGDNSSRAQVEEMTILRAAVLAKEEGKDGLIILTFSNYNRMVTQTMNGTPIGAPTLAGYKTELEALFVDRDEAARDHPDHAGRIIAVDDILATLSPIYVSGK